MNQKRETAVQRSERCYRRLLSVYPASFRKQYGGLMAQLFRDQCRRASQDRGAAGLAALWWRILWDWLKTVVYEHLSDPERKVIMKMWKQPNRLAAWLLITGLVSGGMSFLLLRSPVLLTISVYVCCLASFGKAVADWFRPHSDWWRSLWTGVVILVAFGLFLPAWAKARSEFGPSEFIVPVIGMLPVVANFAVPLLKALVVLIRRFKPATPR